VLTSTSLKLVSPQEGKPKEGFFKFNVELSSLLHSSETLNMGTTLQDLRFDIAQFIDKVAKSSRATDRESLCIVQGKLVWSVQVDLFLLNDDGNLVDAFFLASILALLNTRLPEVAISRDSIKINNDKLKPLNVHHLPVCTSFYFVDTTPIVDPTAKEEKIASARLSICMNIFEDLCGMTTLGSLEIEPSVILDCTRVALKKTQQITKLIRERFATRHTMVSGVLDVQLLQRKKPSAIK
jgi:exosome complex component RRP45